MTPTYEVLAARAECAVLGALLLRPDVLPAIAFLDTAQFADAANAALFDAIRTELAREATQTGAALAAHLQAAYAITGASVDFNALIDACPDPGAVAAYARILIEADLHRAMAIHAVRLAEDSEPGSPEQVEAVTILRPEPLTTSDAEQAPSPGSWNGSRSNREERILADLVQHPNQIEQASEAINATTFTVAARDDLFDAISAVHKRGEPVDAVTVAWELDRIQADGYRRDGVDPAAYVDRLAAVPVGPGTALDTARKIASQEQLVAERQARRAVGPGNHGAVQRSLGRSVANDTGVRPRSYGSPSPDKDRRGPRIG